MCTLFSVANGFQYWIPARLSGSEKPTNLASVSSLEDLDLIPVFFHLQPTDEGLLTGQTTPPSPSIRLLSSSDTSLFLVLCPRLQASLRCWLPTLTWLRLELVCYVSDVKLGEFYSHIHKADPALQLLACFPATEPQPEFSAANTNQITIPKSKNFQQPVQSAFLNKSLGYDVSYSCV